MSSEVSQIEFERNPGGVYVPIATTVEGKDTPELPEDRFLDGLDELNESFDVPKDTESHHRFELAVVNEDQAANGTVLFTSTSSSSFSQNPGNAAEQAAQGAVDPTKRRVYVAYAGNGGTSGFSMAEAFNILRTGRLTKGDGTHAEALGLYQALARVLEARDMVPDQLSADVEGGRFALGLAPALDPNTLKKAYFNGTPGMATGDTSYYSGMLREDLRSHMERTERARTGSQPEWDIDEMKKIAKDRLTRVYGTGGNVLRLMHTYFPIPNLAKTLIPTTAYGKHAELEGPLDEHALAMDMITLLNRHEAMVTMQVNRDSKLHDPTQAIRFGEVVMNTMNPEPRSESRGLKLILEEGELDEHTNNPGIRWRNEGIAFSSFMGSVFAGLRFIQPDDITGRARQAQEA